jgi:hypothetical protein
MPLDYFWIAVIRPESMPSAEIGLESGADALDASAKVAGG